MAFASGFAVVVLFLPSGPAGAQGLKVNDPLAIGIAGDVTTSQLSPDSTRVVYLADQDADEVFRVYSVPIGDGSPVALGTAPVQGGDVRAFEISPSSRHVVYRGDQDADEVFELYSVSIAGRGPATRLNAALPPGADVAGFEIAPRTERVVFGVEAAEGSDYFSVPITGGVPVHLTTPLAPGVRVQRLIVSPDGRHVLYQTGPSSGEFSDLFRVSILGGPVVQLDPPLEHPRAFEFSPDSKRVVFLSSKLYATTPLGGPAIELAEGASGFEILADSSRVLFLAPGDTHRDQLHLVELTGGPAQKLTEHGQQRVNNFVVSPDLQRIAYALEAGDSVGEVRTIPITGGPSTPIQLGNELYVGLISPDSSRLVYAELSDSQSGGPILYSVPLAGGTSTRLTDLPVVPLRITPDSKTVICYDYYFSDEATGVFSVPITGGPTVQLSARPVSGGAIVVEPDRPFLTRDGTRLVYRADQDFDEVFELFSVSTQDGPVQKLNAPLAQGGIAGDVRFSAVSPDGRRVAYLADQDTDEVLELYSAAIPGGAPVKLNGALVRNGDVSEFAFQFSPDSARVVYVADQELDGIRQLYSVPIDGGVPVRLNAAPAVAYGIFQFQVSRDSRRVVFSHDQVNALRAELFSVPIDGGPVVDLSADLTALDRVTGFEITPDSGRVLFGALRDGDGVNLELYGIPIDGGPTVKLNPTPVANGGVAGAFQVLADSSGVVYPAALEVEGRLELYHTPIAGGPSTKLSPPLSADQDVFLHPTSPDAAYVVFRVDRFPDGPSEIYSTSLAGFVRTKLNPPLVAGGSVRGFEISADSSRVVYRADQGVNEVYELFSVPIGGGAATRVSAPMVAGGDVDQFQISGDSSRVVYLADQNANDVFELYSVPVAGGTSVKLNAPLVSGGDVLSDFAIRGGRALYRADQEQSDVIELFAVSLAGGVPPEKLNAPLVANGDVLDSFFPFQPAGNAVLYRADQDADEVVELYLSFLSVPSRSSGRLDTAIPPP